MRSRIVLLAALTLGLLLATGQAAYGASALSDTTSATVAQYEPDPCGKTLPSEVSENSRGGQVPATCSKLPFTGYAAMPLILLGLAVLCGGLVLRCTQRSSRI